MRKAELPAQLKPGILGVKVRIMPPDAEFPDQISIVEEATEPTDAAEEEVAKAEKEAPEQPELAETETTEAEE